MINNKLYLSSLLILITTPCVVKSDFPFPSIIPTLKEGCVEDLDLSGCKITYHCWKYVNEPNTYSTNINNYPYSDCKTKLNNDENLPIHLRYEISRYSPVEVIPIINNDYMKSYFVNLDISREKLSYIPDIEPMNNLALLNLSRNSLFEAKLYNKYELKSLREIDYSNNHIHAIEVREDLYYYNNLRILNLSHNYIANIPNSIFELFKDMEYLDISYNYIDNLNSLTFEGLKNLLHLNLSHNRIVDISSSLMRFYKLTELDLSFNTLISLTNNNFESLKELKSLNLSNNEIDNIQIGAFENFTSLFSLDLSHNKLTDIDKDMFKNHVYLKSLDLSSNYIRTLPTFLFKDKRSLSEISLKDNSLEGTLMSGTFDGLELVTDLDLGYQHYTDIEDLSFVGMKNLKILILKNNVIATLGKRCFKTLSNLISLDLSGNRISSIDFDKSDLSNLRELYFQDNNIAEFIPDYFTNLHWLQFLDISDNKISVLQPHSFTYLSNIKNIAIKGNPISGVLEDGTFNGLSSLPKLDISGTSITTVSNSSFKGMSELKELNISHCKVSELQYNVFEDTTTIEVLDLSFNKLNKFEINSTTLINLNQLLLNNNVLLVVSPAALNNLHRLNKLVLSHNDIRLIEKDSFLNNRDLRYLDISFNSALQFDMKELEACPLLVDLNLSSIKTNINFTYISNDVIVSQLHMSNSEIKNLSTLSLGKLSHVEDLFLDHNEITNVKGFYNLTSLRMLDLSYNNISYIQPGAFKDNIMLYTLNVSHNNLLTVNYGIFKGLNYLSVIDFSYNIIESLESERFFEVGSLTELYVDHNNIKMFNAEKFSRTNLAKLSIGDNPIPCDVLVNINYMDLQFIITAINKDDSIYENVNGITCNRKHKTNDVNKDYVTDNNNDKILTEIKKMIQSISKENDENKHKDENVESSKMIYVYLNSTLNVMTNLTSNIINENKNIYQLLNNTLNSTTDVLSNLTSSFVDDIKKNTYSTIDALSNLTSNFLSDTNNTNILLNKILTAMTTYKKTSSFIEPNDIDKNTGNEKIVSYIKTIKLDLQDEIAKEKARILSEVDKKIASSIKISKESALSNAHSEKHTNVDEVSHSKSLTFVEICLGLMVTILLGFIIYKIYMKRNSFTPRQTSSTRNLPEALDNSTL